MKLLFMYMNELQVNAPFIIINILLNLNYDILFYSQLNSPEYNALLVLF